jgi:hypothetical protein
VDRLQRKGIRLAEDESLTRKPHYFTHRDQLSTANGWEKAADGLTAIGQCRQEMHRN